MVVFSTAIMMHDMFLALGAVPSYRVIVTFFPVSVTLTRLSTVQGATPDHQVSWIFLPFETGFALVHWILWTLIALRVGLTGSGPFVGVVVTGFDTTGGFSGVEGAALPAGWAAPHPVASTRHPARRVAVIVRISLRRITRPGGSVFSVEHVLRQAMLALSKSRRAERLVTTSPLTSDVVGRYVAGDIGAVVGDLTRKGLLVTVDHLGEEVTDQAQAEAAVGDHLALLRLLPAGADVSIKLTALGLRLSRGLALDHAAAICAAAERKGVTVTLDAEEHDTIPGLHAVHAALRREHPEVGVVVQAYLPDSLDRCEKLVGARVRLCKGAYTAPGAYTRTADIDRAFVRCLKVLMAGTGYPMVATHDPRLVRIASTLAVLDGRDLTGFEYQMLYGVRPEEQARLAGLGARMRVYVPYGSDWYAYLMRRLAERPRNLAFFLRSLASRR